MFAGGGLHAEVVRALAGPINNQIEHDFIDRHVALPHSAAVLEDLGIEVAYASQDRFNSPLVELWPVSLVALWAYLGLGMYAT